MPGMTSLHKLSPSQNPPNSRISPQQNCRSDRNPQKHSQPIPCLCRLRIRHSLLVRLEPGTRPTMNLWPAPVSPRQLGQFTQPHIRHIFQMGRCLTMVPLRKTALRPLTGIRWQPTTSCPCPGCQISQAQISQAQISQAQISQAQI
jgi:hypothetical protein